MLTLLAAISGDAMVAALIWLVVGALIFWLVLWAISFIGIPEPFNKVLKVVVALAAVLFLANILLGLAGHPLFK